MYTHTLEDLVTTKEQLFAKVQQYRHWAQRVSKDRKMVSGENTGHLSLPEVIRLKDTIDGRISALRDLDQQLVIESAGVAQALDALRKALDVVESRLVEKNYEEVADLGYRDVSSEFIFLQRTMGRLQSVAHELSSAISDIAGESSLSYEQVEPHVKTALNTEQ